MSTTTDIKFEFYIDSTSDQDTSTGLSPADATDLGLNAGIVVDQLGGGITFSNAGSIKGGKTDWDVGIGFWLGYQDEDYKVAIGDPANEKVTWDGNDLVIDIDASNLKINGAIGTQGLVVQSNGTVQFTSLVEELNDLADVTGTTHNASIFKVLIPQSGNTYGFVDLRSVTDSYIRLRDLSDVGNTSPSNDNLLQYNSSNGLWTMVSPNGLIDFSDLGNKPTTLAGYGISDAYSDADVDAHLNFSSANTNDILAYNGNDYEWVGVGEIVWMVEELNDLSDVTISGVANDHILQYNSSTSKFENVAIGTAIGSANLRFEDLSNAGTGTAQNNQFWRYNSSNSKYELTLFSIQEMANVTIDNTLANGHILKYNSSTQQWENEVLAASGIQLTDLSVGTEGTASGNGNLAYNNSNGVFTYTPPTFAGLDDTNFTNLQNNDTVVYNSSTQKFVNLAKTSVQYSVSPSPCGHYYIDVVDTGDVVTLQAALHIAQESASTNTWTSTLSAPSGYTVPTPANTIAVGTALTTGTATASHKSYTAIYDQNGVIKLRASGAGSGLATVNDVKSNSANFLFINITFIK